MKTKSLKHSIIVIALAMFVLGMSSCQKNENGALQPTSSDWTNVSFPDGFIFDTVREGDNTSLELNTYGQLYLLGKYMFIVNYQDADDPNVSYVCLINQKHENAAPLRKLKAKILAGAKLEVFSNPDAQVVANWAAEKISQGFVVLSFYDERQGIYIAYAYTREEWQQAFGNN